MTVLTQFELNEDLVQIMKDADPDLVLKLARSHEERLEAAAEADVIFSSYDGESPADFKELLKRAKKVRWIHTSTAGVDKLICPELKETCAIFTCTKGAVAGPLLAEHAMALLLSVSRNIGIAVKAGRWDRAGTSGRTSTELRGKTMGIVGFGGSGQALAQMAHGFGMKVLALKRTAGRSPIKGIEKVWGRERLHELLEKSDVVAICAPGTPETKDMFGPEEFKLMKQTAIIINIGRGDIINETALVAALQNGEIAAAGLDVLATEPVMDDHPFWKMENVVLTPHIAGNSPYRNARNKLTFAENFCRFIRGEPLEGAVQIDVGY